MCEGCAAWLSVRQSIKALVGKIFGNHLRYNRSLSSREAKARKGDWTNALVLR